MSRGPIPTALIGLPSPSSSSGTYWAAIAHLPYLLSPRGQEKYKIVALLNSSVDAARRAIAHYKLPAETRAYGDPHDLAADPDVELVVCNTRVDKHDATTRPSVEAGKDVFVEWPLAHNETVARELATLAAEKGVRSVVGLQGRLAPVYLKVAEVLRSGKLGKVVSSEVRASGGGLPVRVLPASLKYLLQKEVGGNMVTIGFSHVFDNIQDVLGRVEDPKSTTQIRYPEVDVSGSDGTTVRAVKSNVPDLLVVSGHIPASSLVSDGGANLTLRFRREKPFKGEPGLVWTVQGDKGELRLTAPAGPAIQAISYDPPITIEVHDHASDEVTPVEWSWQDWQEELPVASRNIAALYEAFAEGGRYPTFQDALRLHEQIEGFLE